MLRNLNIQINCGDSTCASKPGEFCNFFATTHFGMTPVCSLFQTEKEFYTPLNQKDGWVQRCKDCLDSE